MELEQLLHLRVATSGTWSGDRRSRTGSSLPDRASGRTVFDVYLSKLDVVSIREHMSNSGTSKEPKAPGVIDEFKNFAFKGNVVDLAVGVIIGGAFGSVVKALTDWMIMPFLGLVTGGIDFSSFYWMLKAPVEGTYANLDEMVAKGGAVIVRWGAFINTIITFLLVAVAVFGLVKMMNRAMASQKMAEQEAAAKAKAEETAKAKREEEELAANATLVEAKRAEATRRLESVLLEIRDFLKTSRA